MLQRTEQPATHPGRTQSATFTPKMPLASQTTSPAAPPTHGDPESLPVHAPRERTRLLRSILSQLAGWFRRHPFLSATALYSVLMGVTAGVVNWSYGQDWRYAYDQIPYNESGVRFFSVTIPAGFELTRNIIDRTHRTLLSGRFPQQHTINPMGDHGMWGVYTGRSRMRDFGSSRGYIPQSVGIYSVPMSICLLTTNSESVPTFSYDPGKSPFGPGGVTL